MCIYPVGDGANRVLTKSAICVSHCKNRIAYCIEDMFSLYAISQITEDMYYQFKTLCKFELNKWLLS